MPLSSWSTSTERLPLSQSRATSPWPPTGWRAARSVRYSWMPVPAARGPIVVAGRNLVLHVPGEDVADAGLPGLVAVEPGHDAAVDDSAHAGHLGEQVEFITWQVEVPMIATIWPGSTARAAGAVTCASTLPTATAMPSGSPVQAAASADSAPGGVAELADRVGRPCRRRSRRMPGSARPGIPGSGRRRPGRCPCSRRCRRCGRSWPVSCQTIQSAASTQWSIRA